MGGGSLRIFFGGGWDKQGQTIKKNTSCPKPMGYKDLNATTFMIISLANNNKLESTVYL